MKTFRYVQTLFPIATLICAMQSPLAAQWNQNSSTKVITTNNDFNVTPSAKIGIGTSTPSGRVSILGSTNPLLELKESSTSWSILKFCNGNDGMWNIKGLINSSNTNDRLNFEHDVAGTIFTLTGDGNVGIGNSNPATKFSVSGSTWPLQELKVNTSEYSSLRFENQNTGYWDVAGKIGTTNAQDRLNFYHDAAGNVMSITGEGKVGINNINPSTTFSVNGSTWPLQELKVGNNGYCSLRFSNQNSGYWDIAGIINASNTDDRMNFYHDGAGNIMTLTGGGNVGIGTTSPTYKLSVNGTIRAKEIRVETGWSDFVFEEDFRLRPLEEVQKYIQENKHLPDVTSASEIQANGLPVAEVMTEMMQKIEELTLYVIGLKKDNADLHRQLDKAEHQN